MELKQLNLCATRRRRQMASGSIANLSVTRKTLGASYDKKPHLRAFGSPSLALRSRARLRSRQPRDRGDDGNH
jgi:hypothetical protein